VTGLERELQQLGGTIAYPPTPDLAPAVLARLAEQPRWRPRISRRALAIGLAALALAAAAAMAVPQARTAILEWFGLEGASIERVSELPEVPPQTMLDLGRKVTLQEARRSSGHAILVPTLGGFDRPDAVYVDPARPGRPVTLLYGPLERPRLLLSVFQGQLLFEKLAAPGTKIEPVTVDGARGVWLEGKPHVFVFRDEYGEPAEGSLRLAGNTLLWNRGRLLLRLEADISKEDALRIARSVR
jgi:hypothetical protein